MTSYETYLRRHPNVSRLRAERLLSDGVCFFTKSEYGNEDIALLPGNSSMDDLVSVTLRYESCSCNVFRTKRACPHVAAVLGIIEKNGGKIPYTDPSKHVFACLERLKNSPPSASRYAESIFLRDVKPFLSRLPREECPQFLLELAYCYQAPHSHLTEEEYVDCCVNLNGRYVVVPQMTKLLFQNRKDCTKAIVALMRHSYSDPFTEKEKKTILTEIAQDDKLAAMYLPSLTSNAVNYASYFSREQLLRYYDTLKPERVDPFFRKHLLKRLAEEEPPMYDRFLDICNASSSAMHLDLDFSTVEKLIQAGYGDRLGKVVDYLVDHIRSIKDYEKVRSIISHEAFLASWKSRKDRNDRLWWNHKDDWELEIDFREDPDANPDRYDLESLDCSVLKVILQSRPEYREQINQAVRKIYRKAIRTNQRKTALEALMLLALGNDSIAVKYASEWDLPRGNKEELVYLMAVGTQFDAMEKLFPDMKAMEVPYAAEQN